MASSFPSGLVFRPIVPGRPELPVLDDHTMGKSMRDTESHAFGDAEICVDNSGLSERPPDTAGLDAKGAVALVIIVEHAWLRVEKVTRQGRLST
jgi:hypothetical protein